MILQGRGLMS
ncbi:hypothetical protein RDABS01_014605 [Bienertia sinuspersici]